MALFLFLVCSVLAAVILSAATVASGRVAGLAEADQKYYSVMSAAGLFRDMMGGDDGVTVQIQCVKTTQLDQITADVDEGNSTTTCIVGSGDAKSFEDEDLIKQIPTTPIDSINASSPLLEQAARDIVLSGNDAGADSTDYAYDWEFIPGSIAVSSSGKSLKLVHDGAGFAEDEKTQLVTLLNRVTIKETIDSNGNIIFSFASDPKSEDASDASALPYKAELVCKASARSGVQERVKRDSTTGKFVRTEIKTTDITWVPSELKVSAGIAGEGA